MMISKQLSAILATAILLPGTLMAAEVKSLKAGELKNAGIESSEKALTISGQMNAADFSFIFDNLAELETLNLSNAEIVAYSGDVLPYTGMNNSPAATIPAYSLTGLTNLKTIKLPNGLKVIGKGAFSGSGITEVDIPATVSKIEDYAFMRCPNLQAVKMGQSVNTIGTRAFAYCPKLSTVTLSTTITTIPEGLFEACGGLQSINLADLAACTDIGPWALAECNGISTLVFPENTEIIGKCSLYGTSSIESLTLPSNLYEIHDGALGAMNALSELHVEDLDFIPELGENVWTQVNQPRVTLVTPDDLESSYRDIDQWNKFNIVSQSQYQASTDKIESTVSNHELMASVTGSELNVSSIGSELGIVSVFNVSGARVASTKAHDKAVFNIANWPSGVYLIVTEIGVVKTAI